MKTKKIVLSTLTIFAVAAVVVGATTAFFSDTETSTDNVLAAGSIDLGISNDSWYNGEFNQDTSWTQTFDLDSGKLFFNFNDLKPGDWGEDTIDLEVHNNDSWLCADVTLDTNNENDLTEPEVDMNDDHATGELADRVNFIWWADDGDNVLESDEELLPAGTLGSLGVGNTATVALADSTGTGVLTEGPVTGETKYFIGKAWCFGNFELAPVPDNGGQNPGVDPGFTCDGSSVTNDSQSDSLTATISFRAEQSRNNGLFVCSGESEQRTALNLDNKVEGTWTGIEDGRYGDLSFISSHPTFDYSLNVYGMNVSTNYTLLYYADPYPSSNGIVIGTFGTDGSGNASVSGDVELNADLPVPTDTNYPGGAKLWVIPSSYWTGSQMTGWNSDEYLYEMNLVTYDDTDVS